MYKLIALTFIFLAFLVPQANAGTLHFVNQKTSQIMGTATVPGTDNECIDFNGKFFLICNGDMIQQCLLVGTELKCADLFDASLATFNPSFSGTYNNTQAIKMIGKDLLIAIEIESCAGPCTYASRVYQYDYDGLRAKQRGNSFSVVTEGNGIHDIEFTGTDIHVVSGSVYGVINLNLGGTVTHSIPRAMKVLVYNNRNFYVLLDTGHANYITAEDGTLMGTSVATGLTAFSGTRIGQNIIGIITN